MQSLALGLLLSTSAWAASGLGDMFAVTLYFNIGVSFVGSLLGGIVAMSFRSRPPAWPYTALLVSVVLGSTAGMLTPAVVNGGHFFSLMMNGVVSALIGATVATCAPWAQKAQGGWLEVQSTNPRVPSDPGS